MESPTQHISQHTAEGIAKGAQYGGATSTAMGTLWTALGDNAVQIGLLFTFLSMCGALYGTYWLVKHKRYLIAADKRERAARGEDVDKD